MEKRVQVVLINMDLDHFVSAFNKYEIIMALEHLLSSYPGATFTVVRLNLEYNGGPCRSFHEKSHGNNDNLSTFEEKMLSKFEELDGMLQHPRSVEGYSIFCDPVTAGLLGAPQTDTLLLGGFYTECEIMASVIDAVREKVKPVIISDLSSSRSERIYYKSLDILSLWAEIGDTRELLIKYVH